jgi:hypothetical protein
MLHMHFLRLQLVGDRAPDGGPDRCHACDAESPC